MTDINAFFSHLDEEESTDDERDATKEFLNNWLDEDNLKEADYNEFEQEYPVKITCVRLYVCSDNNIEYVYKDNIPVGEDGLLGSTFLHRITEDSREHNGKYYDIDDVLYYNLTAKPRDILQKQTASIHDFLHKADVTTGIIFNPSSNLLHDINTLYIILKENTEYENNIANQTGSDIESEAGSDIESEIGSEAGSEAASNNTATVKTSRKTRKCNINFNRSHSTRRKRA